MVDQSARPQRVFRRHQQGFNLEPSLVTQRSQMSWLFDVVLIPSVAAYQKPTCRLRRRRFQAEALIKSRARLGTSTSYPSPPLAAPFNVGPPGDIILLTLPTRRPRNCFFCGPGRRTWERYRLLGLPQMLVSNVLLAAHTSSDPLTTFDHANRRHRHSSEYSINGGGAP